MGNGPGDDDEDLILPLLPEEPAAAPRATAVGDTTSELLLDPNADLGAIDELDEFLAGGSSGFTSATMVSAAVAEDMQRAIDAGVSMAATLIEPLPATARASLEMEARAPFVIRNSVTIVGRSQTHAEVVLENDDEVSRQHAAIIYARGGFFLEDLSSANGTFLEERRIKRVALRPGQVIRIGRRQMRFVFSLA